MSSIAEVMKHMPEFKELPDDMRVPLHSLQADILYLFGRVAADGRVASLMADSVLQRLSQIETAAYRLANHSEAASTIIALRAALESIEKRQWQHRETFHEGNAWPMAQKLNKEIVEIYAVARKALEDSK
jgi:hypothetical protein